MYVQNVLVTKLNYTGAKRQKLLFYANKEVHCGIEEEIEFGQLVATCCQIDLFFLMLFFSITLIRWQVFVTFYLKNEWSKMQVEATFRLNGRCRDNDPRHRHVTNWNFIGSTRRRLFTTTLRDLNHAEISETTWTFFYNKRGNIDDCKLATFWLILGTSV